MKERTCLKCGWVAFGVTRDYAEDEVARFNAYYDLTLTPKQRQDYYGGNRSAITCYERCLRCGGPHTNFRDGAPGDCPDGCTLNPIIVE